MILKQDEMSKVSKDPQEEAIQVFDEVIRDLTSPTHDLKLILRRCLHACLVLGWVDQYEWFQRELAGYPGEEAVPAYRNVRGRLIWHAEISAYERSEKAIESVMYGPASYEREDEPASLEVWHDFDFVLQATQNGHAEATGETKDWWWESRRKTVRLKRVKSFKASAFAAIIQHVERLTFEFASQSYVTLRYVNVVTDIWMGYRAQVDAAMGRLGLSAHLDAIQTGMQSDNPEAWRAAVLECRNLLNDLANYLWRDPRQSYEHLQGGGARGQLDVQEGRFANRLGAYLHQKGLYGTTGKFLRNEVERLAASIRSLIELQSTAHSPVTRETARSVALATYFIIGELIIRSDMNPVERYLEPAAGLE